MSQTSEISFVDLVYKIVRNLKVIVLNFVIITVVAVIISLLLPKWYKAQTVIMPPIKDSGIAIGGVGQLAGMMLGGGGGDFDLPMFASPSDIFEMILKSTSVRDSVIQRFGLMALYKKPTIEETRLALDKHTFIEVGEEGAIFLGFEAEADPELAAEVAQYYLEKLDEANRRVKVFYAHNSRKFVEGRLDATKLNLAAAEDSLSAFQQRNNAIAIQDQVTAAVNNAGQLLAMKQMYEVQFGALAQGMSGNSSELRELKAKISSVDKQIREIKYGKSKSIDAVLLNDTDMFPALANVPELGLQYARRLREVKIQEVLFELLTQQYEQEKIKEAKNTPTVVVLDHPVVPTKKSRPKRAIIVIIAAMLSVFYSLLVIFLRDYQTQLRETNPEEYQKWQDIANVFCFFKKRRN
ncbi:hypothetical protein KAH55_08200 [bacterium]|nr:hypothetical protein [bacterium]